jgi:Flp pilus assembly CpaF family ATPase
MVLHRPHVSCSSGARLATDHSVTSIALGSLTPHAARFLGAVVAAGLNVLVAGSTRTGDPTSR